jgi:hypothetical protein
LASAQTLTFDHGCTTGPRIRIAAVGDLLFHNALQRRALTPTGTFRQFWQPVQPILDAADIVYGNLEGPAAEAVSLAAWSDLRAGQELIPGFVASASEPSRLLLEWRSGSIHVGDDEIEAARAALNAAEATQASVPATRAAA